MPSSVLSLDRARCRPSAGSGAVATTTEAMAVEEHDRGQPQPPTSEQMEVEPTGTDGAADGATDPTQCARSGAGVVAPGVVAPGVVALGATRGAHACALGAAPSPPAQPPHHQLHCPLSVRPLPPPPSAAAATVAHQRPPSRPTFHRHAHTSPPRPHFTVTAHFHRHRPHRRSHV
eukprot:295969-Prymnesium_polylepis.3